MDCGRGRAGLACGGVEESGGDCVGTAADKVEVHAVGEPDHPGVAFGWRRDVPGGRGRAVVQCDLDVPVVWVSEGV